MTALQSLYRSRITGGYDKEWVMGFTKRRGDDRRGLYAKSSVEENPLVLADLPLAASPHRLVFGALAAHKQKRLIGVDAFSALERVNIFKKDTTVMILGVSNDRVVSPDRRRVTVIRKEAFLIDFEKMTATLKSPTLTYDLEWEDVLTGLDFWERAVGVEYSRRNQASWVSSGVLEFFNWIEEGDVKFGQYPKEVQQYAISWYNNIAGR